MFRLALSAWLLMVPGTAMAQDAAIGDGPPERVRSVLLYGEQACPEAQDGEIVVCAREEDSPYRIPSKLRNPPEERPDASSWANRVDDVMEANRAGLPNSCSPIGSGGQSGCTLQMIQRWGAERRAQQRVQATIP